MIWLQKYFHKQFQLTSGPWYIFDRVLGFYRNIDLDEFMGVDSSFEQWRDWRLNNEISYSFLLLDWVDFVTLKCFLIELILSLWSVVFDCMANRSPNRENADLYRCDQTINIWNQSINKIYPNIIQYSKIIKTQILA